MIGAHVGFLRSESWRRSWSRRSSWRASALVADFVASSHADLQELDDALAAAALDEARRRAHRIKGAARIVGANAVVALAQQLETAAASAVEADRLVPLAARLRDALAGAASMM